MKEMIAFFYNLQPSNITNIEDFFEFEANQSCFLLYQVKRSKEELEDIYHICEELKMKGIAVHTFILNRENKIISNISEKDYILLKTEIEQKEMNIIDIINFQNNLVVSKDKANLYRNNWSELWSKKIDYFEYQIRELGKSKKVVLNSFSYYVGLAENAIAYANSTNNKLLYSGAGKICLNHRRLVFPNLTKNYYNPLLFIFDLQVRDIAEYLKSAFFKSETDAWIEFKAFLTLNKRTIYEYQMFYARMLYPSYYFDIYEKIMNNEETEENLIPFIEKSLAYEEYLKKMYYEINKIAAIEKINWLINKKEL
jgi:spore coat protein YutH